jgi:pimeloyl-ACP methyl ester carboxylesterase
MDHVICIKEIGSFFVGGDRVTLEGLPVYSASMVKNGKSRMVDPNGEFWAGQMYVQYIKLSNPTAKYPLLLWHGGGLSGSCWETTPDDREGWQMFFLRAGYNVYISDAVERGRASWARYPEIFTTEPVFRSYQHAWESFRIGKTYCNDPFQRKPFPGSQYPVDSFETFMMYSIPRWSSNNDLTQKAYEKYVQKMGPCILIAHSQGCSFAAETALHYPQLIKAVVFIEPSSMPDYQTYDLKILQNIPQLYIWGDFLDEYTIWNKTVPNTESYYKAVKKYYQELKKVCKRAEWLELPEIGIRGNTHMMMHDKNSSQVAVLILDWLNKQKIV